MRTYTKMFTNINEHTRNPDRWCHIKERAIRWSDKKFIQANITLMVDYIDHLEKSNKDLVDKNNELLSQNIPTVATPEPEQQKTEASVEAKTI